MKIKTVTITGADNQTNPDDLIELSKEFPFVEWGILFSPTRNINGEPRYPTIKWIQELKEITTGLNMKFSAHVCGGFTKEFLEFGTSVSVYENITKNIGYIFNRAQLNFNASKHTISDDFYNLLKNKSSTIPYIIQYNKSNSEVCKRIMDEKIPVHFLYDSSGGRGISPTQWKPPIDNYFTGYSGGLSPINLEEKLIQIESEVDAYYLRNNPDYPLDKKINTEIWIDTETAVRTDDKLDLVKVHRFLEIAEPYTK